MAPNAPYDWRSPQNTNFWQGLNGVNNPCPSAYRLPSEIELENERLSWSLNNSSGAFASLNKLNLSGYRNNSNGSLIAINTSGSYWSSTISGVDSRILIFSSSNAFLGNMFRARGASVRCIKESVVGSVLTIDCNTLGLNGNLYNNQPAWNVTASVPYTGGNGGYYAAQTTASTGVTGLTATLSQGLFANGVGSVTYTITGTPANTGTAVFAISLGGQSCNLALTVTTLAAQYPANSVFCNHGPTAINEVTNPITGRTWMDRNLGASIASSGGIGTLGNDGDYYQWGRNSDGHQCTSSLRTTVTSSNDQPNNGGYFIETSMGGGDWRTPSNNNLWQGINGINNPCPNGFRLPTENEWNTERSSWGNIGFNQTGSTVLKLDAVGYRAWYNTQPEFIAAGIGGYFYGYYWSCTVLNGSARYLYLSTNTNSIGDFPKSGGVFVRCIKETVGSVGPLNCGGATTSGNLFSGSAANNVSSSLPYTGGNGGYYAAQTTASTGVTGLTATLGQGLLANGNGSVTYTITGTPASSGTATFAISIGGQSCSFTVSVAAAQPQYPAGTVHCAGATTVVDVTNPITGLTWMDRNLGASQVATSSTDQNAYGDLYQWGRRADGHQCRTSATTTTLSSVDQPAHGNFILSNTYDWRSPENDNLWQGVNGINNPCPSGYRLPTETELNNERLSWGSNNSTGAFASPLKWTMAGNRSNSTGSLGNVGTNGRYWTSTVNGLASQNLIIPSNNAGMNGNGRANGFSVRCLKN